MARQLAVAIGVPEVGDLPVLGGVPDGVTSFAEWATAQGFEVVEHVATDHQHPVTGDAVFKTVREAIEAGDVERLFVFFSGHGLGPGIGDDYWLLSDAAVDPGAAINVARSVALARHCGIPHVAFFADACRTPPDAKLHAVTGRPIFPQVRVPNVRVAVDQFYATISGDPAYEKQPGGGEKAFGVFTRCLLRALGGTDPDVVTEIQGGSEPYAVLAHPLGDHLWTAVRATSSQQVGVTQSPDCVPGSVWPSNVISWVPTQPAAPAAPPAPPPAPFRQYRDDREVLVGDLAREFSAQPGRNHFETGVGATVAGAALTDVRVENQGVFEEDGAMQIRGVPDRAATALLQVTLAGGGTTWAGTALIPGYVTTLSVGRVGVDHVAYVALRGDDRMERDRHVLARAAAAQRVGTRGFLDDRDARSLLEEANPTMSVLAAYAFHRLGQEDDVAEILDRCRSMLPVVPYDIALLAGEPGAPRSVPDFPMMTRGWALADTIGAGDDVFAYARSRLAPTPWTTFTELAEGIVEVLVNPYAGGVLA